MVVANALFIRQDWLDTLGLEQPETIEDWYEVLTAFKNEDPNGNGIQDEIPLSGIDLASGLFSYLLSAYDLPAGVGPWWYDENGEVFCVYTTEEYKNFVTEMNRWYAEGLIDMELTRDEANFQALCATNTVGAFSHLSERETQYNNLLATSGYPEAVHSLIHHPAGTKEVQVVKRDPTWNHYAIPASSDKAELAVKWMKFVWGSDEGVTLTEWGIEGKTWEEVDGKKQYTDFVLNNPDGLDPYNALRSLGASNTILVRTPAESYVALNGQGNAIPYAESTNMIEPFPNMMSTPEEQDILDMYSTDFDTYCSESILGFITGTTDMGEWQSFVDTLNSIGLEELRTVKQAQYDRSRGGVSHEKKGILEKSAQRPPACVHADTGGDFLRGVFLLSSVWNPDRFQGLFHQQGDSGKPVGRAAVFQTVFFQPLFRQTSAQYGSDQRIQPAVGLPDSDSLRAAFERV